MDDRRWTGAALWSIVHGPSSIFVYRQTVLREMYEHRSRDAADG